MGSLYKYKEEHKPSICKMEEFDCIHDPVGYFVS